MNKKSRMYEVNGTRVRTWNPFVGCKFNCSYCYAPEIYKRFSKCEQCKAFTPHFHPERLQQKFKAGETVFVCSMGDISFASFEQFNTILEVTNHYLDTTFYIQSKNPVYFVDYIEYYSSVISGNPMLGGNNVVLGTTIETNQDIGGVSKAPSPKERVTALALTFHPQLFLTAEPLFDFDLGAMVGWAKVIVPEFVYVGYLNPEWKAKRLQISEPPLMKTLELIEELGKFTEVRLKTIRKAWNEE